MTEGWRDIESAPRDGTRIIGTRLNDKNDPEVIAWIDYEGGHWVAVASEISGWYAFPPTHWMPLPDPPVSEAV